MWDRTLTLLEKFYESAGDTLEIGFKLKFLFLEVFMGLIKLDIMQSSSHIMILFLFKLSKLPLN